MCAICEGKCEGKCEAYVRVIVSHVGERKVIEMSARWGKFSGKAEGNCVYIAYGEGDYLPMKIILLGWAWY